MSAGLTIHAEGITWPLETYLDAHGFQRFTYEEAGYYLPPFAEADKPGVAILAGGEMVEANGRDLPWTELIAFRAKEGASALCIVCGEFYPDCELYLYGNNEVACEDCLDASPWA